MVCGFIALHAYLDLKGIIYSLLFTFFLSGKKDKVNRKVVLQPKDPGGFGVVSSELKAQALLVQCFDVL